MRNELVTDNFVQRKRYRALMAVECALLGLSWVLWNQRGLNGFAEAIDCALCLWHIVVVPICIMYLIGRLVVMTLSPLIDSAESRALKRDLRQRSALNDNEFYARYFQESAIPEDLVTQVREIVSKIYPLVDRIKPFDPLFLLDDEIDFADILFRIERRFGIRFNRAEWEIVDGTFDNLVRHVQSKTVAVSQST